jgi:hypothetical protein
MTACNKMPNFQFQTTAQNGAAYSSWAAARVALDMALALQAA